MRITKHVWCATQRSIVLYGTARGLKWLHERGVIHRDVKPANVFLDGQIRPWIGDLGMAKPVGPRMTAAQGTVTYMAPEVVEAARDEDAKDRLWSYPADVYALGISFWEILSRVRFSVDIPKRAANPRWEAALKIRDGARPRRGSSAAITNTLWALMTRMWDADITKRPDIAEVSQFLALSKYWVPGTDPAKFHEYVAFLDAQEAEVKRNSGAAYDAWRPLLDSAKLAIPLAAKLGTGPVQEKVVHALGILAATDGKEDTELMQELGKDLRDNDSFVRKDAFPLDGADPRLEKANRVPNGE
jgi:serine/threonine protein kinase